MKTQPRSKPSSFAKTLVVNYYDGGTKHTIYLSMDIDDLRSLSIEVDRARLKTETVSDAISDWGATSSATGSRSDKDARSARGVRKADVGVDRAGGRSVRALREGAQFVVPARGRKAARSGRRRQRRRRPRKLPPRISRSSPRRR